MKSALYLASISGFFALNCVSAVPAWSQNTASEGATQPQQGAALWRTFRFGMSPEEVVAEIVKIPEVKSAKFKYSNGVPKFDINYVNRGMSIFGQIFEISPVFKSGKLELIVLRTRQSCLSSKAPDHKNIFDALSAKFPNKVYTSDQVVISTQAPVKSGLTDGHTRVLVNLNISELPDLPKVPRKKYENTVDWQYEFAKGEYERVAQLRQDRLYQCPNSDYGAYADIAIVYADEADQIRQTNERLRSQDLRDQQKQSILENEAGKL